MQRSFFPKATKDDTGTGDAAFKRLVDQEKASSCLNLAKRLDIAPKNSAQVVELLIEAIGYGSQDAGNYLAKKIIRSHETGMHHAIDVNHILGKLESMEAINSIAAYVLGEIYAGFFHPITKNLFPILPEEKASHTRQEKAIRYFNTAIAQGNAQAHASLSTAFVEGKGCIVKDEKQWIELNKRLADGGELKRTSKISP